MHPSMLPKKQLEQLADARADEAQALLKGGFDSGAYYLAGYAVEFALKARIATNFQADAIPDKKYVLAVYDHSLETLIGLAGLRKELDQTMKLDPQFAARWGIASKWSESARYDVAAAAMVGAVTDPAKGLLQWIKQYW